MTIDDFRKFQKEECPFLYGKRAGRKSIYGCPCCRPPLTLFKKLARKKARVRFKIQTRKTIVEEVKTLLSW